MRTESVNCYDDECKSSLREKLPDIQDNVGCMWEKGWDISFGNIIPEDEEKQPCPHCVDRHVHLHTRKHDMSTFEIIVWICPRVIVAFNEGGYSSTGVCLDCVLETAKLRGWFAQG